MLLARLRQGQEHSGVLHFQELIPQASPLDMLIKGNALASISYHSKMMRPDRTYDTPGM